MPAIEINGTRLAFQAFGAGSTVVALHASASNGGQWNSLADHLQSRHCIFAPDLPGYGKSHAVLHKGAPAISAEADAISGLIEAWQEPVHLVGHSYGGAMALQIALARPEWVKSLTLIEPTVFNLLRNGAPADQRLFTEVEDVRGRMAAAAACGEPHAGMAHFIAFWNGPQAWARTNPKLKMSLAAQIGQVLNNFAAGDRIDWTLEDCSKLDVPTQAIMATESPLPAQRVTEMLAEAIPAARLHIVPGAGHMLPLTDPHIVDPLIAAHVARNDGPSAHMDMLHAA
jgi:pimeloyl-ACP methyl ester carboxylesterase